MVAHLECLVQIVPWMGLQLFETEGDALLLVVEVDDYDLDVLIAHNLGDPKHGPS